LKNLVLNLNSIGNAGDRQQYREALVAYLTPYKGDLDADSQDRLTRNPLRILDSKDERTQAILTEAPSVLDHLNPDSSQRFEQVQTLLTDLDISFQINTRLVRGLDYYTHTVFEIQSADLGAQATVGGGGRYDGLVTELGGADTPAVGWAIGIERLVILLQQLHSLPAPNVDFYLVSKGTQAEAQAVVLAQRLRHDGFTVELDLSGSAFGKQFKRADRSGAAACLILGDEEAANQTVQLKWLATGNQAAIAQSQLFATVDELHQQIDSRKTS